jgi:Spy/CpxP family protein refolding chaperone
MKKSTLYTALGVGGFLILSGFAAPHWHGHPGQRIKAYIDDLLDDVKATDAQRQQITAIEDKILADAKALHQKQQGSHQELLDQWNAAQPDTAKLHALIDAHIESMRTIAYEVSDGLVQAHGVLTPEQRAEVGKRLQKRLDRMDHMGPQP